MDKVLKVLTKESNFKINGKEEFNKILQHIVNLIKDTYLLYENKSFSTATFLSITAIEKVSKANMGLFVKSPNKEEKVKKDLLRYHKTKEIIQ